MALFSGLDKEGYDRQYTDRELLRRIAAYFRPYRLRLILVTLFVLLIAAAGAATPVIVSRAVDALDRGELAIPGLPGLSVVAVIWLIAGIVFAAGLITWFSNWARRRLVVRIMGDIILRITGCPVQLYRGAVHQGRQPAHLAGGKGHILIQVPDDRAKHASGAADSLHVHS